MMHKGRLSVRIVALGALLIPALLLSSSAFANRRAVVVLDTSTSGKLVRISVGARHGIILNQPVLFTAASQRVAAGRVVRVDESNSVVLVLEKYGQEAPTPDSDYELVYGEPFPEAANLPDYVSDRDEEEDNPGNEKFMAQKEEEVTPELDDDNYSPEVTLRPKFPLPRSYSPHNLTVGFNMFRARALPTSSDIDSNGNVQQTTYTTYSGYSLRYAYTFRSNYWLKSHTPALISAEIGLGIYSFSHTWPTQLQSDPTTAIAEVRVIPVQFELRYLIEVSRLFRLYPYVGYQYNLVSAVNGSITGLDPLGGGTLLGGAGAALVMSEVIDARLEAGTDGVLAGLVVKF